MYDAIIVGCGISGGAVAAGLGDLKVLILEKNKKTVPKDSGIVSGRFLDYYDRKFIGHEISRMELVAPGGKSFFLGDETPFAYILKREAFARYVVRKAKKHADFRNEYLVSIRNNAGNCTVTTNSGEYEGKVVIGCDGAVSSVRRCLGISQMKLSVGTMVRGSGLRKGGIQVFFNNNYSQDFFSWIIPHNDEYGLMAGSKSSECLGRFRSDMGLKDGKTYAFMIPTGMTKSNAGRCILVGDACGQNKPLTGGGIIFSLIGAGHAIPAVKKYLATNDPNHLERYDQAWKSDIGLEIRKQLLARRVYSRMSNDDINRAFSALGPHLQDLRGFDYDRFSASWRKLPKMKLARILLSNIRAFL